MLLVIVSIFAIILPVAYEITYYSTEVEQAVMELPKGLAARYIVLTSRMLTEGANLSAPHTKAMSKGLFELRLKSAEGIARVFYCTLVGKQIVMLHSIVKKTPKTPTQDLKLAYARLKEIKDENP